MCKQSSSASLGLGTVIALASSAVLAIVVLRVIETILWGLAIAAIATAVTVLAAGTVMACRYRRSPAPWACTGTRTRTHSPAAIQVLPAPLAARELTAPPAAGLTWHLPGTLGDPDYPPVIIVIGRTDPRRPS